MQEMMDNMIGGYSFGILWALVPLLLWGGLLALVVWVVVKVFPSRRGDGGSEDSEASSDRAVEILRERVARGEIDAEEYERALEVLRRERNTARGGI